MSDDPWKIENVFESRDHDGLDVSIWRISNTSDWTHVYDTIRVARDRRDPSWVYVSTMRMTGWTPVFDRFLWEDEESEDIAREAIPVLHHR